jgi:hypothetical protein
MAATDPNQIAAEIAAAYDAFAAIDPGEDTQGLTADRLRAALSQHATHLDAIKQSVQAVATAVDRRKDLIAERDATMPSDEEIADAEQQLVLATAAAAEAAAGADRDAESIATDKVARATDRLADLLAQKKAVQDRYTRGEQSTAESLDTTTTGLLPATGAPPGLAPLGAWLLSNLQRMAAGSVPAPMMSMPALAGPADEAIAMPSLGPDPTAALLQALLPDHDDNADNNPHNQTPQFLPPFSDPPWSPGMGQTHTSADLPTQMPTMPGALTTADVSGRPANPFIATPPPTAVAPASGPGPAMIPPMMPMGAGAAGTGVASGRDGAAKPIIKQDPDLTGADIDAHIATSGVIGRDTERR